MGTKTATITLQYLASGYYRNPTVTKPYKVTKVTDSVEFSPGDYLTKAEVDGLCHAPLWKVTIQG